jgi:chromosome segregation ATPase
LKLCAPEPKVEAALPLDSAAVPAEAHFQQESEPQIAALKAEHDREVAAIRAERDSVIAALRAKSDALAKAQEIAAAEGERQLAELATKNAQLSALAEERARDFASAAAERAEATHRLTAEREALVLEEDRLLAEKESEIQALATEREQATEAYNAIKVTLESERVRALQTLADRDHQLAWKERAVAELEGEVETYRKRIKLVLRERDQLSEEKTHLAGAAKMLVEINAENEQLAKEKHAQAEAMAALQRRLEQLTAANCELVNSPAMVKEEWTGLRERETEPDLMSASGVVC